MTEKNDTVYIAEDGKKFLTIEECEAYESLLCNIKFFIVSHTPDLNETGLFTKNDVVAVYSDKGEHLAIVERWCVSEKGYQILGPSVMGYGFQRHFEITEGIAKNGTLQVVKERWNKYRKGASVKDEGSAFPLYDNKVFLSPIKVGGFPEPFDYISKWFLKD